MTHVQWTDLQTGKPASFELIGYLGEMLDNENPAPAREQLDVAYAHGGGWSPFEGFALRADNSIKYPGDPAYPARAEARLRGERIYFYDHAWVAIVQPDGAYEIARMD